jgi:hypothetical protein
MIDETTRKPLSGMDIGWVAGLLEGEGSFFIVKTRGGKHGITIYRYAHLVVGMTDLDTIQKFHRIVGCTAKISSVINKRGKLMYHRAHLTGKRAVEWMMTIYCLMSQRRQAAIRKCLDEWKRTPSTEERRRKACVKAAKNRVRDEENGQFIAKT